MPTQVSLVFAPSGVIDLGRVGGGSGARRLAINGTRHICKCPQHSNGPWVCFNEFLSARIASRLGLPIPPYTVAEFRGDLSTNASWICSQEILSGYSIDNTCCDALQNRDTVAGIILFDLWVCNTDRKGEHLIVDKPGGAGKLFMIDHGHILLTNGDFATLRSPEFERGARFLSGSADLCRGVLDVNEFGSALETFRGLSESELWNWIEDSPGGWVPEPAKLAELKQFLPERREKLRNILQSTLGTFPRLHGGVV